MRRREALVGIGTLGAATFAGCTHGRSDITGPSSEPQPVTVLSGRTEMPVPSLGGQTARLGESLYLQAPGFFTLNTAFVGTSVLLWPGGRRARDPNNPPHAVYTRGR